MRTLLALLVLAFALAEPAVATSYLAGPAPEVAIQDVIQLAVESAKQHLPDADAYHIIDAGYNYHGGDTRYWLVIFAKPSAGYFFVGVYSKEKFVGGMRRSLQSGERFVGPEKEE